MDQNDKKDLIVFLIFTFLISWPIWFLSGVLSREDFLYDAQWLFAQVGVFGPTLAAVMLQGKKSKEIRKKCFIIIISFVLIFAAGLLIIKNKPVSIQSFSLPASISVFFLTAVIIFVLRRYRYLNLPDQENKAKNGVRIQWILGSLVLLPFIFLAAWILVNLQGEKLSISAFQNGTVKFTKILLLSFSVNFILGGPMGEEFGWRGYALPVLLKKYNPTAASVVLGFIWALWHFPIDITNHDLAGPLAVVFRIIWTLPLTVIFTWFFLKTNGSILIALFLHTSVNILPDLGFKNYENSILLMTLLLYIAAFVFAVRPEMRCLKNE